MAQCEIDTRNAEFWDELCGSSLAQSLGITGGMSADLRRFDEAYLELYPYLTQYVVGEELKGKRVLEIGLGYGTLGQVIAQQGCLYHGLDIAQGPVRMMCYRLSRLDKDWRGRVQVGSVLNAPYRDCSFDYVYSIGCLHHTGSLKMSISEVYRILDRGGKAVIMLYNKNSFRLLFEVRMRKLLSLLGGGGFRQLSAEKIRGLYDTDSKGVAAPHTDFVSSRHVRRLFKALTATHFMGELSLRGNGF
jgi:SAM-dependent methyltransferase